MTELPQQIDITIQEEDRQNAGTYKNNDGCLIATALGRMGYNHDAHIMVYPSWVKIGDQTYLGQMQSNDLCYNPEAGCRPYYGPKVVGKTFTLTRGELIREEDLEDSLT